MPDPRPYLEARREARRRMLALDARTQQHLHAMLREYTARLTAAVRGLPTERAAAIQASREVTALLTRRFEEELVAAAAQGRALSFETTRQLWIEATERIVAQTGVPNAVMGAVRAPPITMLGAFEAMGTGRDWRTLMRGHVRAAAAEVQSLVATGITEGKGAHTVAREIRRYMDGAEPLSEYVGASGRLDLRKVPEDLRGAARRVAYNADRLALTEIHSARHEAEVQHQIADPFVESVRWTLSPDRGNARIPDGCDFLAQADYYGLGPGVFPVYAAPSLVHPFDRCELIPVPRELEAIAQEKPNPARQRSPQDVTVPGLQSLTKKGAARARGDALGAIQTGEAGVARARRAQRRGA